MLTTGDSRTTRLFLLLGILAVFLLVPLRIMAYGYMPPDDAMRHTAFAVVNRLWGDVILLDPHFPAWMDTHPGWHAFLRAVHGATQWDQDTLVSLSVALALWTFTMGGAVASGNLPAWFLACALMSVLEPALFGKLALGRPLFFSMTAVMVLLFLWTRRTALRLPLQIAVVGLVLSVNIAMHPSSWYLWAIAIPPLAVCRQWRAIGAFLAGWALALVVTGLVNGWTNGLLLHIDFLRVSFLQGGTVGPNLVSELQPSAAPVQGLLAMAVVLLLRRSAGREQREEWLTVDLAFVVTTWVLGLYVSRFWIEWGLPAMAVWFTRQIGDGEGFGFAGMHRRPVPPVLVGVAAATFYLGLTADVGGRYTNTLRNALLITPIDELSAELPEDGGVLYTTEMAYFYGIFHRLPNLKFRYVTGMEPGLMPAEDLKVMRAIQSSGLVRDYKPWFDKMRPVDRVIVRGSTAPQWPEMEFKPFYGSWIGHKVRPKT